ncbi:MAG: DUF4197 domain-containing protein [Pseudomonadota bacterium]
MRTPLTRAGGAIGLTALCLAITLQSAQAGWLDRLKGVFKDDAEASESAQGGVAALGTDQIASALREALRVGAGNVVGQLGAEDGFNLDPTIHIPLPDQLDQARTFLARVGLEGSLTDLEAQLNRAAEVATSNAGELFVNAISQMTLEDVRDILQGPDDAATRYFRSTMGVELSERMTPVVSESLDQVGAARLYEQTVGRYNSLPLVPPIESDLTSHVVNLGIDGIFHYLAEEEAAIRADPAARTSDLLRTVFSAAAGGN